MAEHELIRRKILLVGGGIILCLALVVVASQLGNTTAGAWSFGLAGLVGILLVLTSLRWIWRGVEMLTGLQFAVSFPILAVGYMLGVILSPIVLPLGLIILTIQYFRSKKRFEREVAFHEANARGPAPK